MRWKLWLTGLVEGFVRVDEVPAVLEEVIEDFKRRLLVALAHHIFPVLGKPLYSQKGNNS